MKAPRRQPPSPVATNDAAKVCAFYATQEDGPEGDRDAHRALRRAAEILAAKAFVNEVSRMVKAGSLGQRTADQLTADTPPDRRPKP